MSDYTKYLRLMKPQGNEYYNVENFNHNAELIDKETEKLNNAVTKIQEGATREKAGIVQFGTEEGKALEGMMLARLAGCVGYGGDIQTAGVKDVNYLYYDRNTRKMYKCLNQNSDVSANVTNFIPLDNNSLLDRLENLFNFEYKENWETITGCVSMTSQIIKLSGIMIQINTYNFDRIINKTRLTFPVTFKGAPFVTVTDNDFSLTESSSNYRIGWSTNNYVDVYGLNAGFMIFAIGRI